MADLSGVWLGTYWQRKKPVRFEMTLVQGGNSLSGRVLDDNYLGSALLAGKVSGRSVNFSKTYITASRHSVNYTGTISEDGKRMKGEWRISLFSGNWEAQRSDEELSVKQITRRVEKVPGAI